MFKMIFLIVALLIVVTVTASGTSAPLPNQIPYIYILHEEEKNRANKLSENALSHQKNYANKSSEDIVLQSKLVDYTRQLALYTDKLARFTQWLMYIGVGELILLGFQLYFLRRSINDTGKAAEAAKKSADVAERSLITTEGAFVYLKNFNLIFIKDSITQKKIVLNINVTWENSGTTPAKHVLFHISWKIIKSELPEDFEFADEGIKQVHNPIFIGPKAQIISDPISIPVEVLLPVAKGIHYLYIWGWIEYNDIFSSTHRHRTEFCNRIAIIGDLYDDSSEVLFGFPHYRKHNGYDDDCYRRPIPYISAVKTN